jgi:hypothetical protein
MVWHTRSVIKRDFCPRCTEARVRDEPHSFRRPTEEELERIGEDGTCESGDEYEMSRFIRERQCLARADDEADEAEDAGAHGGKAEADEAEDAGAHGGKAEAEEAGAEADAGDHGAPQYPEFSGPALSAPVHRCLRDPEGFYTIVDKDFYTETAEGRAWVHEMFHGPDGFAALMRDLDNAAAAPAPPGAEPAPANAAPAPPADADAEPAP